MHNFLDVLLKLFVRVGDSLCADKSNEVEIQGQLDFLCMSIFKLGQDVADASPLLWRRTLKLMQSQLQKRLRDFVQGESLHHIHSFFLSLVAIEYVIGCFDDLHSTHLRSSLDVALIYDLRNTFPIPDSLHFSTHY